VTTQVSESPPQVAPRLPKELLANTAFLLARIGYSFKARALDEVEGAGYSLYDYSVMAVLAEEPREAQATIANALGLDRSQLVGILDSLEERGLIERQRDPSDRRRHMVSLTTEGRKQLGRIRSIVKRLEEELLAPLDAGGRAALHGILLDLARHHDPRCCAA
jgi:DNA-binding MarR family transcriptional regulator